MKKNYKIVNLDCKLDSNISSNWLGFSDVDNALRRVNYRPLLTNWPQSIDPSLFLLNDEYNSSLAADYSGMAEQSHRISPCGEIIFDKIWCVGRDGLRADIENGVVYVGACVNWVGMEYLTWWIENSDVGFDAWTGPNSFTADFGEPEYYDDDVVMMKEPGYNIFGHWLLDYVPQLKLAQFMDLPDGQVFVFDHLTEWMKALLAASGIENCRTYDCRLSEHKNMRSITGLKNGYALAQPINTYAWNALRLHFNHANVGRDAPNFEKIYVSRSNWGGHRPLSNAQEVESLMEGLGFQIFYPELYDLTEQSRILSGARVVVGEDGSGLHSVIFARPGARLGVLMHSDRRNLWHAGIGEAMGHRIGYFQIGVRDDQPYADPNGIKQFIEKLIAS